MSELRTSIFRLRNAGELRISVDDASVFGGCSSSVTGVSSGASSANRRVSKSLVEGLATSTLESVEIERDDMMLNALDTFMARKVVNNLSIILSSINGRLLRIYIYM